MGCASSKRIEASVDLYRPAPASFAVFDINAVQEPWLAADNVNTDTSDQEGQQESKPTTVHPAPVQLLEKLNKFETDAPVHSWDEVSKALEELKPTINNNNNSNSIPNNTISATSPTRPTAVHKQLQQKQKLTPRKSASFHTLEELDEKLQPSSAKDLRKSESLRMRTTADHHLKNKHEEEESPSSADRHPHNELGRGTTTTTTTTSSPSVKPGKLKENIFILRDRMEREKEGMQANYDKLKRDPLGDFPAKCPPGGSDAVVVYTTSLRGVRRTYEDCSRVRSIFEVNRVVTDERDVSLHGEFLNQLKDLLGDGEGVGGGVSVPRVFVKGRYIGGADKLTELNESGKLGRMLRWARVEMGVGRQACEGCGGARFVPCLDCGGSCKVVLVNGDKERCRLCNENGLVLCPACS